MLLLINEKECHRLLKDHFPDVEYSVAVCGSKPYLQIYTSKFLGKTYKEQQQMVRDVLKMSDIGIDPDDIDIISTDNPSLGSLEEAL